MTTAVRGLALALVLAGVPSLAAAADPREVAVLRIGEQDESIREVATRTHAELAAGGVKATLVDCATSREACREEALRAGASAVVVTFRDGGETATEVRRAPRPDGAVVPATTVRAAEGDADPRVLAIRAVELVRAILLEPDPAPPSPAPPARAEVVSPPRTAPSPPLAASVARPAGTRRAFSVGLAGICLASVDGLGAAYGLRARAEHMSTRGLGLAVSVAAVAFGGEVDSLGGTVSLRQELAVLELVYRMRRHARVQPHLALGLGAYRLSARGTPRGTFALEGTTESVWAVLGGAGAGATVRVSERVGAFAEAQMLFTTPSATVDRGVGDPQGATPSLLVTAGLQTTF